MEQSPRLSLSYLAPSQSQKHVTVNETFRRLDQLVQMTVLSRTISAEPASPLDGDAYILPASPAGAGWQVFGQHSIAAWQDGAWVELVPQEGWRAWVADENALLLFDGFGWINYGEGGADLKKLGVNTHPDAINRLAVKSDAILFSHDDVTPGSGDAQIKVNKAAAGDTASLVFQTDFSARAEFGLTGDDDFHFKVSPDGAQFFESFRIDRGTGEPAFEQPLALKQYSVSGLPSPGVGSARLIYVWDETGGPTVAYSDGGSWRRIYDNVVVS